jgi:alpha-1,6-mannosyltransferase
MIVLDHSRCNMRGAVSQRSIIALGIGSGGLYAVLFSVQRLLQSGAPLPWLLALYVLATLAVFGAYVRIVAMAASARLTDDRVRRLAVVFPVLISIALAAGRPHLSIDVFTYIAQGYQARMGDSPYAHPVKEVAATSVGVELARFGWIPVHGVSPYGPIWTWMEIGAGHLTTSIAGQMWLLKAVVLVFTLGCGLLVWIILGHVAPADQWLGTMVYLWNPVVLMELAGEGHNDAVPIFFLLLSLLLCIRRRAGAGLVALTVGALTKIVAPIIAPLEAVYLWHARQDRRRLLVEVGFAAGCAAALAGIVYGPLWIGAATFDGLRAHGQPAILPSTPGVLYWYLTRSHSETASARLVSLLMMAVFAGYVAIASRRVIDARSLLRACAGAAFLYLVLAPGYWPWYAAIPVALMALSPRGTFTWWIIAVSLCSRLAAPIDMLRLRGLMDWEAEVFIATIVGVWSPAVAVGFREAWRAVATLKGRSSLLIPRRVAPVGASKPVGR